MLNSPRKGKFISASRKYSGGEVHSRPLWIGVKRGPEISMARPQQSAGPKAGN
jgi:hypothetical protein